jgi:hypothetical protein
MLTLVIGYHGIYVPNEYNYNEQNKFHISNFRRLYKITIVFNMLFLFTIMYIMRVPCATGTTNK